MPKQIKGNGLGLSITKVAVEKLGGSIGINSEIDYGTNVFIKIPNK
jgi:signal transduction histidine kinase